MNGGITTLFGKTYFWVQATQTGQRQLHRAKPVTPIEIAPWASPDHDVVADLRAVDAW